MIKTIALSGGPCGGKSSALDHLKHQLSTRGYRVITMPEVATSLLCLGISPGPGSLSPLDFERLVLERQLAAEAKARRLATIMEPKSRGVIIIYDRSLYDIAAYLPRRRDFVRLLAAKNLTPESLASRYDAIFHLVSAAVGTDAYSNATNSHRHESPAVATRVERKTLRANQFYPRLVVIDNSTDFPGKLDRLTTHLLALLEDT